MGGGNKNKSWSGVYNNIFDKMNRKAKINEIALKKNFLSKILKKLRHDALALKIQTFFDVLTIKQKAKGNILFMFDPIYVGKKYDHYVYFDMTYSKLVDLLSNSEIKPVVNYNIFQCKKLLKFENKFFEKCKCVFCMSNYIMNDLNTKNPKIKTKVVYAGANHIVEMRKKYGIHKILFVGNDFKRKNGYKVIEAFKIVKNKIKDAELYLCTKEKINKESYSFDGIHMLGDLNFEDLQNYFEKCSLFCMPSIYEPFGIVFVEAIISGMPCVGLNRCEMSKIIGNNGICVDKNDVNEIANAIITIFENEKYYENVIKNHEYYLKKYSWDSVSKNIIDEILKNNLK